MVQIAWESVPEQVSVMSVIAVPRVRYVLGSHVPWEWSTNRVVNFIYSQIHVETYTEQVL